MAVSANEGEELVNKLRDVLKYLDKLYSNYQIK
jgi:hypothetical protein